MKWKPFISKFYGYCMEFSNIRLLIPSFYTHFGWATIRKWIEGNLKWFWKLESEVDTYHSYKPLRPICDHYWVFLWQLLLLKYFITKNLVWRGMLIPNFGVSTTILNPIDIPCRWYKLNFWLLQGQVKSYHFYE